LIAPAFAIGGYWGTVAWIGLLGAFGSMFVWQAGYIVTRDVGSAWFGWSAVVLTAPALVHGTPGVQDFWLMDFTTNTTRMIARVSNAGSITTFDITPDGARIVFDRVEERSNLVLIDRAQ
jgi:hypothetical protein